MALTFSLTLNDINKPIHGFITPNVDNKWCLCQAGKSSILVPNGGHLGLFFTSNYKTITYKWIAETKYNWKSGVFNLITPTGPSPEPLPSPAMELTGEDGDRCRPKRNWSRRSVQFVIMMRWCIIRWKMRRSRIRRSLLSEGRLLCRLLGRLLSSASTTTSASHQENTCMMRLKQMDDNNAVVDGRDTVEEWWERRLPTSFYTMWIDVMRSPTKR